MACSRLQLSFLRTPGNHEEDVAVMTSHYATAVGAELDATQMAQVEARWTTYWNAVKIYVHPSCIPFEFRWYSQQVWPTPSPLMRVQLAPAAPGTGTGNLLPPQCAISNTLQTPVRKRWGRFYLPSLDSGVLNGPEGRVATSVVTAIGTALHAMAAGDYMDGNRMVVYSPRGGKGPPAFPGGSTEEVSQVRVDDIVDIVRRRRWQDSPFHSVQPIF